MLCVRRVKNNASSLMQGGQTDDCQSEKIQSLAAWLFLVRVCPTGSVLALRKLPWDFQNSVPGSLGLPSFKATKMYLTIYKKKLERICMLFSLKWQVYSIRV